MSRTSGGAWIARAAVIAGATIVATAMIGAVAHLGAQEAPRRLDTLPVTATREGRDAAGVARVTAARTSTDAREAGAGSVTGLLQQLPLLQLRSARGETAITLRGARREQLTVTLDGLPLNDPATGMADVSDLPLVLVDHAELRLGADPRRAPGALGGELALVSSTRPRLGARVGAFGERQLEGAARRVGTRAVWHAAAGVLRARNDFPFVNAAGASPSRELRVNNDETSGALAVGATGARWQWSALASRRERGMVGPANVRTFDADRARTDRVLLRGRARLGSTAAVAGVRRLALAYRDPARPALDRHAAAWAADLEWQGQRHALSWQVAVGADQLAATGDVRQQRQRGSLAAQWRPTQPDDAVTQWEAGARVDAITGAGVVPTGLVAVERRLWRAAPQGGRGRALHLLARWASAFRAPTLVDLYFAAPQRLAVAPLAPERVRADATLGVRASGERGPWQLHATGSAVVRTVRDAIVWFPGNFGWSPANVGEETLRGGELLLDAAHPHGRLALWATHYRATLHAGALRIPTPYVPVQAAGAQGRWRLAGMAFTATVRATGRRPYTAGPRSPDFELPAVTIVDFAWSRPLRTSRGVLLATASLDNATNRPWEPVRGYPAPGRVLAFALSWSPAARAVP